MNSHIPFNKPFIAGKELYYIAQAVLKYGKLSGDGEFTDKCHSWLQLNLKCKKALLTHSCTAALEMAAILANIQAEDEVIMPSFTFVSTANAFVLRGGVPVFIDIRSDTLNVDESKLEAAITEKTKAIVPVHYAGAPCDMEAIMDIAQKYGLLVIEDAAQALLTDYNNKKLGSIGHFGALSFHETKNVISGEGGALLINDERYIERAEVIWEKGTNRKNFIRGEIDKYTWIDIGSSFLPSELTAAFLYSQFENAEKIIEARLNHYKRYYTGLKELEKTAPLILPNIENNINGHIFYIIAGSFEERSDLIQFLKDRGIFSIFHYIPLHSSPAGLKFGRIHGELYQTQKISERILRLPLYYEISNSEIDRVIGAIQEYYQG